MSAATTMNMNTTMNIKTSTLKRFDSARSNASYHVVEHNVDDGRDDYESEHQVDCDSPTSGGPVDVLGSLSPYSTTGTGSPNCIMSRTVLQLVDVDSDYDSDDEDEMPWVPNLYDEDEDDDEEEHYEEEEQYFDASEEECELVTNNIKFDVPVALDEVGANAHGYMNESSNANRLLLLSSVC